MKYMFISENKLKHSLAVARYMQKYAVEHFLDEKLGQELFVLGYLHDIGEEFTETKEEHNVVGGLLLKEQKYKYWKEVYYHGNPKAEYSSLALQILNLAELCINSDGSFIGIDTKLAMLREKFGETSVQYVNSLALANKVRGKLPRK